jgi:hypothetical protein
MFMICSCSEDHSFVPVSQLAGFLAIRSGTFFNVTRASEAPNSASDGRQNE